MRLNKDAPARSFTHEGAPAKEISAEHALRRSLLSCLLWEGEFYEDGQSIADRIDNLADQVSASSVAYLAVEARSQFNIRHASLLLLCALARRGGNVVGDAVERTIQRPDEMAELLALYWRNGRRPIPAQFKKGLARAFTKFDAYQLAKYNRPGPIKLRDVLFLVHAKPLDWEQAETWRKLVNGTLESPDTWEVNLSAGGDKKGTFERLLMEGRLGYMALLRNLRKMKEVGVDEDMVRDAIVARKGAGRVLPFRYVAAARACPSLEPQIDKALRDAIGEMDPFTGKTAILVDVSASMGAPLSEKSYMSRMDAAAALGAIIPGDHRLFTFSSDLVEIPPRRGMAGVDAIINSQPHGSTYLGDAVSRLNKNVPYDRLVVITDEQSHDPVPGPNGLGYMINVASNQHGVGYGPWVHIDGFSENVLQFMGEYETSRPD